MPDWHDAMVAQGPASSEEAMEEELYACRGRIKKLEEHNVRLVGLLQRVRDPEVSMLWLHPGDEDCAHCRLKDDIDAALAGKEPNH